MLDDEVITSYYALRVLPDGRLIGLQRLLFHWTVHVDIDSIGYNDRYCFETFELGMKALATWDGTNDPEGWHKHPKTGRRRDLRTRREWIDP